MIFHSRTALLSLLLTAGCGGKLVAQQRFTMNAELASLSWETQVPAGQPSLWLEYAELSCPSERTYSSDNAEPVYTFVGNLRVSTGGNAVYDGGLRLAETGTPTSGMSGTVRASSRERCGPSHCELSGRVKIVELDDLAAGSPLLIEASLPPSADDATVGSISMQLRAKQ